jgi:hypothetical protein
VAGLLEGNIRVIHTSYQAVQRISKREASSRSCGLPVWVHARFIRFIAGRNDGQLAILCNRITNSPGIGGTGPTY